MGWFIHGSGHTDDADINAKVDALVKRFLDDLKASGSPVQISYDNNETGIHDGFEQSAQSE